MRAIPVFYYSILIGHCLLLTCDKYDQSAEREMWKPFFTVYRYSFLVGRDSESET